MTYGFARCEGTGYTSGVSETLHPVWRKHPELAWSNPAASDAVRIRAALLRPRFDLLLEIAAAFGVARLREEWDCLSKDSTPEYLRAKPIVERILANIAKGEALASA